MAFYVLNIGKVRKDLEDQLTLLAFENGATGVSENLNFNKKVYPEPEIIESEFKVLTCYFDEQPSSLFEYLSKEYPNLELNLSEEENKDWLLEWKKGFKSFQLVNRFWIVPSWEKVEDPEYGTFYID